MSKIKDIAIGIGIFAVPVLFAYALSLVVRLLIYIFKGTGPIEWILMAMTIFALYICKRNA